MKVLLLGATGLLGSHLAARLPRSFATVAPRPRQGEGHAPAIAWLSSRFDATDDASIAGVLEEAAPDVIVNAVAITPSSPDARDPQRLEAVNARFPRQLASLAARRGARVVHVSSDGVFSGARGGYCEEDAADPIDAYGQLKLAGELSAPHLTIRTSVFGQTPRHEGLIEWLIAQRGRTIDGFVDYRFTGVAAGVLAGLIVCAVQRRLEGLYHVGGEPMTKYELLRRAAEQLQLDVTVRAVTRGAIDRTLDASRFFAAIDRRLVTLDESIATLQPCLAPSAN